MKEILVNHLDMLNELQIAKLKYNSKNHYTIIFNIFIINILIIFNIFTTKLILNNSAL